MARKPHKGIAKKEKPGRDHPPSSSQTQDNESTSILGRAVLVTLMWGVTLLGLERLFLKGPWISEALTIGAAAILLASTVLVLFPGRRGVSAASGGLGATLVWLLWQQGQAEKAAIHLWLSHPSTMIDEVAVTTSQEIAPFAPYGAFEDVLVLAALLVSVLCMVLLIVGNSPMATVLVLSLLMLVPTMITGVRIPGGLLLGAGIILALVVWIQAPRRTGIALLAVGASVVMAGGLVAAAPAARDKMWNQAFLPSPVSADVPDVTVTLARDLRARSTTPAFDYTGSVPGSYRFTLTTLADFTDGRWLPDEEMPQTRSPVYDWRQADTVSPEPIPYDFPQDETQEVTITIRGLLSDWLPLPQSALRVTAGEEDTSFEVSRWLWTVNAPTAISPGGRTQTGDCYSATSMPLLYDNLANLSATESAPYSSILEAPEEVQRYLDLPGEVPAVIAETAWEAAGDRGDRITTAFALQEWFRSGEFTYNESAPYDPGADPDDPYSVITALLDQRSGFCVHYASAFAVMARELGLPTRLAVGYASQFDGSSPATVSNGDLHAWPEVYVDNLGWVAFEPTPGGAGLRADTGEEVVPEQSEPAQEQSLAQEPDTPEPTPQANIVEDETNADNGASELSSAWWFLSLVLLLAVPAGLRTGRTAWRKNKIVNGLRSAQPAWDEFVDTAADLGFLDGSDSGALKPRAKTAEALIENLEDRGVLNFESAAAARRIRGAMELEKYAKSSQSTARTDLVQALNVSIAGMKSSASRAARIRAILVPRSLARQWQRG